MSATAKPYVWLFLKTEETDFKKVRPVSISGEFLQEFVEEVMFNSEAVDGSPSSSYALTKLRLRIFDPAWTYWETLFLLNKVFDYEYGWMDDTGKVISTSGRIRAMIEGLAPSFSFQGTTLEVTAKCSLAANALASGSNVELATNVATRQFVPLDKYNKALSGKFYNDRFPSVEFTSPQDRAARERSILGRQNLLYHDEWVRRSLGNIPGNSVLADNEADAVAKFGPRYVLPDNAVPYTSISDLVKTLASMVGMKAEVDPTIEAKDDILMNGKNVENFIREKLVKLAVTKDGRADFQCWIRGDTIYFKSVSNEQRITQTFQYGGNNAPMLEQSPFNPDSKNGIILSFSMEMNPSLLLASAASHTVAVSVDPLSKTAMGASAISPATAARNEVEAKYRANRQQFQAFAPSRAAEIYRNKQSIDFALAQNYMMWQEAGEIAKSIWEANRLPGDTSLNANADGTYSTLNPAATQRGLQDQVFQSLVRQREAERASLQAVAPSADLTFQDASVYDGLQQAAARSPAASKDGTLAGRLYVLPHQNSKTAVFADNIHSQSSLTRLFKATAVVVGNPKIFLLKLVDISIILPDSKKHYASGTYVVFGISHKIDSGGFTTELTLHTTGVSNAGPAQLQSTTKKADTYTKKAEDQPRAGVQITPEPSDSFFGILERIARSPSQQQ